MWSISTRLSIAIQSRNKCAKRIFGVKLFSQPLLKGVRTYSDEASIALENAFKLHILETMPEENVTLKKEDALRYYTQMQTIRRLENACASLYKEKIIRGFCHLYSGQEACCIGMKAALRKDDNFITAYRCHAWCLVAGIAPVNLIAELTGRGIGVQRGKGGSMHMYAPHFFGGNGIVGAQVPLGTGIGFACKYKKDGAVVVALYGDGASNQGQVYEAFNIACLLKIPIIYVCENNRYGMGTPAKRSSCCDQYYTRGDYIPGIWVDGMSILAVRSATEYAIKYVLENGPIILELETYRYMGHSMSDPGVGYRSREEIQEVRSKRDPIVKFRELCISNQLFSEDDTKAIDMKIKKEIDEAAHQAKNAKEIELKELVADVYLNNLEPKIRNTTGYNLTHMQINKGSSPK
ncbi:pyruvate dehydrogenase E1 component subunit alpha type II, mitochondrial-like [Teleopsis dalmanni]|uniref:pyruvate dehydrogenase E1 component subunit alpha type II, mitochondrial-like n=1 Tax=Teleopsis dalmanni TaxID=139649 RepID=UPI0018CD9A92|nr:pyruvate dehydrogenase E1 component subunit alpha type II, mitochondrial-like [Teleopsis dalmanni]